MKRAPITNFNYPLFSRYVFSQIKEANKELTLHSLRNIFTHKAHLFSTGAGIYSILRSSKVNCCNPVDDR